MSNSATHAITCVYQRVTAKVNVEGCGQALSYGICCRDHGGTLLVEIPDICVDEQRVDELVHRMNAGGLCWEQMKDVVEDFIALL